MTKFFSLLSLLVSLNLFSSEGSFEALKNNENVALGIPYTTKELSEIILARKQYVLSWNFATRNLNWVSWKLEQKDFGKAKRSNFKIDPLLKSYATQNHLETPVSTNDYVASCFNRGHNVPSADRTFSDEDNTATFFMSNVAPQTPYLNQLPWQHLEIYERHLAKSGKTLFIVAGPIYDKDLGFIGKNQNIKIPSKFFKIIVEKNERGDISVLTAVIMPNITSRGTLPNEDREFLCTEAQSGPVVSDHHADMDDWRSFETSLEQIQKETGLSFFQGESGNVFSGPILIEDQI